MDPDALLRICHEAMWVVLIVIGPVVVVSSLVGLTVAMLEAVTSIQEQTVGVAARLIAVMVLLLVFGSTIGRVVHQFAEKQFERILVVGKPPG